MGQHKQKSPLDTIKLDRSSELSLYDQLRASIEMAIILGDLPDGAPLPSVRRLAATLDVSPVTVVQAYRELQDRQLVRSVPKRGHFVSLEAKIDNSDWKVQAVELLIDEALDAAKDAELDHQKFLHLVSNRIALRRSGPPVVTIVSEEPWRLQDRIEAFREQLEDLDVRLVGTSFVALESGESLPDGIRLDDVTIFLIPIGTAPRAMGVLGTYSDRFLPIFRDLQPEAKEFLIKQSPDTLFGVITSTQEFKARMLANMQKIHPLNRSPITALIDIPEDTDRYQPNPETIEVFRQADALVIGSSVYHVLAPHLPPNKPTTALIYTASERSIERLREQLRDHVGTTKLAPA